MSNKKKLFENYTKAERVQALSDNAERSEDFNYFREFEPEELDLLKDQYFQDASEMQTYEDMLAAAKSEFKMNATPVKDRMKEAFTGIKNRGRVVTERVFLLADHHAQMMEYYNEAGDMIHSRRLLPEEKQLRIKMEKSGTNN